MEFRCNGLRSPFIQLVQIEASHDVTPYSSIHTFYFIDTFDFLAQLIVNIFRDSRYYIYPYLLIDHTI